MDSAHLHAMGNSNSSRSLFSWQLFPICGNWPVLLKYFGYTNVEIFALKTYLGQVASLLYIVIPIVHADLIKLYSRNMLLEMMRRNWPSLFNSSEHINANMFVARTNPGQIPSLLDIVIPLVHADLVKMNSRNTLLKMMRRNWPSLFNSAEYSTANMFVPETYPEHFPTLLDHVIAVPIEYANSFMWNTRTRQSNQRRGQPKSLNKPQQRNHNIDVPKSNPRKKTSLCDTDKPSSPADILKQNSEVKDLKTTQGNGSSVSNKAENGHNKQKTCSNKPAILPTSHPNKSERYNILKLNNDVTEVQPKGENIVVSSGDMQLKQNPRNEELSLICANTNQSSESCSGTVESEHLTLSEQNGQAIPANNTQIVDDNNQKQPSAMSSVSLEANDHLGNGHTEVRSGTPPLQQSQMLQGQTLLQNRMARIMEQLPLRPRLHIDDNSFQQGGHLPQNCTRNVLLPETMCPVEQDEGPLTPELFKSNGGEFAWDWLQNPVPRACLFQGSEQVDIGTKSERKVDQVDDLALEMSIIEFEEMVGTTFMQPIFREAEWQRESGQPGVNNSSQVDPSLKQ